MSDAFRALYLEASRIAGANGQAGVIGPHGEMVHVTSQTWSTTWKDLGWQDADEWRASLPVYLPPEDPLKAEIDRRVFWQQPLAEALNKLEAMAPEDAWAMLGVGT